MVNVVLGLAALLAGATLFLLWCAARAPMGYEDETGFNFGLECSRAERERVHADEDFHGALLHSTS
jgi:hypothetical protein